MPCLMFTLRTRKLLVPNRAVLQRLTPRAALHGITSRAALRGLTLRAALRGFSSRNCAAVDNCFQILKCYVWTSVMPSNPVVHLKALCWKRAPSSGATATSACKRWATHATWLLDQFLNLCAEEARGGGGNVAIATASKSAK
jgi:hypothetical protein